MGEYIYQQLCDNEVLQVCIIIILVCLELLLIYNITKVVRIICSILSFELIPASKEIFAMKTRLLKKLRRKARREIRATVGQHGRVYIVWKPSFLFHRDIGSIRYYDDIDHWFYHFRQPIMATQTAAVKPVIAQARSAAVRAMFEVLAAKRKAKRRIKFQKQLDEL